MAKRITIMIDDDLDKKVRLIQAKEIAILVSLYIFSSAQRCTTKTTEIKCLNLLIVQSVPKKELELPCLKMVMV
jgi:hypothetical protein